MSEPFSVRVKPNPLASPAVAKIAKPLRDDVKKRIEEKAKAMKQEAAKVKDKVDQKLSKP